MPHRLLSDNNAMLVCMHALQDSRGSLMARSGALFQVLVDELPPSGTLMENSCLDDHLECEKRRRDAPTNSEHCGGHHLLLN